MAPGSTSTTTRTTTLKEKENNKRRERKRRGITAKIFAGLRMYGNYELPKHCDNNHVLRALCDEAGWVVEPDGTTYRKGCKPIIANRCSSYKPISVTQCSSYQPSPASSSLASPASSSYNANTAFPQGTSLIPWLTKLPSSPSSAKLSHLNIHGNSISAPVTPYLCSSPTSPTFSLISPHHHKFGGFFSENAMVAGIGSTQMHSPLQSGTCSPAGRDQTADIPLSAGVKSDEFAFCNTKGLVKAWEGETIHEDCGFDDLELTLGSSKTR